MYKIFKFSILFILGFFTLGFAKESSFILVNADNVEYSIDGKEIVAHGNVKIYYQEAKLSCHSAKINNDTKEAVVEGKVRLVDSRGTIRAEKLIYNFATKQGMIIRGEFYGQDYFGKAEEIERISEEQFVAKKGIVTTCSFDKPHYHIFAKKIDYYPQDKVRTYSDMVYIAGIPFFYLPHYSHSLKDPFMHIQITPGKSKDWGEYILTATRYNLIENVNGRVYLDYRKRLGLAGGFGSNIDFKDFGKLDTKFYHTQERPTRLPQEKRQEYERYLIRMRYKWEVDSFTNIVSEFYRIRDEKRKILGDEYNFLKDYFYREYEKNSQPASYVLLHRNFNLAGFDLLFQKRTNHWYDYVEKLPQLRYTLPQYRLSQLPLYFSNITDFSNLNKKDSANNSDITVARLDIYNELSYPLRMYFFQLNPFVGTRNTLYDKDRQNNHLSMRTIFYTGLNLNTKLYRLFNFNSNFLGIQINDLRHIITPSIKYTYNHEPTLPSYKINRIDSIDTIDKDNRINLELTNKIQTKRSGKTVDFLTLRLESDYIFLSKDANSAKKINKDFSDLYVDLEFLPYSWLRLDSDATYSFYEDRFSAVNYDLNFNFGKNSLSLGQRYKIKGTNELTTGFNFYLNPKWSLGIYERYNFKKTSYLRRGFAEQEYKIIRDLHCWLLEINYNIKENKEHTIWFIFRLKAFPEINFEFNQSYNRPKSGSQE